MTGDVIVFGAAYSVYVRIVRLALEEKGVPYRLEEIDIFAEGGPPADYLARHPFARIPAFEHEGFCLFEAAAITRYVDEAFDGPALMPQDAKMRARVFPSGYITFRGSDARVDFRERSAIISARLHRNYTFCQLPLPGSPPSAFAR